MKIEKLYLHPDRTDVSLTAYIIDDSAEHLNGKPRPAVIVCPGGAYMICSEREGEAVALRFAAMGYHAFVFHYSTYTGVTNAPPNPHAGVIPNEKCQYPAQIREMGLAFLKIREHAELWHVDMERIAVCGFSAGAHVAALYGTTWHRPIVTDYLGVDKSLICPGAMILGYLLGDYVFMEEFAQKSPNDDMTFRNSNMMFLGSGTAPEEKLKEISPVWNVTEETPPAFLWATCEDEMVPVQNSLRMAHALSDKGVKYELHIYEKGQHGLSIATQASAACRTQCSDNVAQWTLACEKWLETRFALPIPDEIPVMMPPGGPGGAAHER